jgi:hypothetical protein
MVAVCQDGRKEQVLDAGVWPTWMPQQEIVATEILTFDFEFFIGARPDFLRNV